MTRATGVALAVGYVLARSLIVAAIVFCLAYGQQAAFWSWSVSLGTELYAAAGMAAFAFIVMVVVTIREG